MLVLVLGLGFDLGVGELVVPLPAALLPAAAAVRGREDFRNDLLGVWVWVWVRVGVRVGVRVRVRVGLWGQDCS